MCVCVHAHACECVGVLVYHFVYGSRGIHGASFSIALQDGSLESLQFDFSGGLTCSWALRLLSGLPGHAWSLHMFWEAKFLALVLVWQMALLSKPCLSRLPWCFPYLLLITSFPPHSVWWVSLKQTFLWLLDGAHRELGSRTHSSLVNWITSGG